jgi:hypothetical protein
MAGVIAVYFYYGTAGLIAVWPSYGECYDLLAEAFRNGHLYLPFSPSEALLAQKDPYSPAHGLLWAPDFTLHEARYYIYWGPVPALLLAIAKSISGLHRMVGDQYLAFSFYGLYAILGALLIDQLARRLFPSVSMGLVIASMLAFAFANPVMFLVTSSGAYQSALAAGQAFMMGGLLLAFDAIWKSDRGRGGQTRLIGAGFFWSLALMSRVSLGAALGLFACSTALACAWPHRDRWKQVFINALLMGFPLATAAALLLSYNKLRFGQWLDFGVTKQLSFYPFRLSSSYIGVNLYSYALRAPDITCIFPFIHSPWYMGPRALPAWLKAPGGYLINEPLVGWLQTIPVTWFMPVSIVMGVKSALVLYRKRSAPVETRSRRSYAWTVLCFAVAGTITGATVLGLYFSSMRYLADVTSGLLLLGVVGAFTLYEWRSDRVLRRIVAATFYALAAATVIIGLLLGYQSYNNHFRAFNPVLDAKLTETLSVCALGKYL